MDKKQLFELLYNHELKELAQELELEGVSTASSRKRDTTLLMKALTIKQMEDRLPGILKKRSMRKTQTVRPDYLLSLLHNYELEVLAKKNKLMGSKTLVNAQREEIIRKLGHHLTVPAMKKEVESTLRTRGRSTPFPSKNVIKVQRGLNRLLDVIPRDLGSYVLEKLIIDELPKSINERGQTLELDSNLLRRECEDEPFVVEYGGNCYTPSFRYGSALAVDIRLFSGMEPQNLLPFFMGLGKVYRKNFKEVLLLVYPPDSLELGAVELEGLNSENIYIVN